LDNVFYLSAVAIHHRLQGTDNSFFAFIMKLVATIVSLLTLTLGAFALVVHDTRSII